VKIAARMIMDMMIQNVKTKYKTYLFYIFLLINSIVYLLLFIQINREKIIKKELFVLEKIGEYRNINALIKNFQK